MIRVHVERLVLEGLPIGGADRERLANALAAELSDHIERTDRSVESGAFATITAPSIKIPSHTGGSVPEGQSIGSLGARIAESVFLGIGPVLGTSPGPHSPVNSPGALR